MVRIRISPDQIDPAALLSRVRSDADGAVLLFVGTVRNHNEGRSVEHLEYEAYAEMAERELAEIAAEAAERWEVGDVAVEHRTGLLRIGEASVAIAVASPHREAAYAASRYIIEELKKRVPIWKREGYSDGRSEWVRGCAHGPAEEPAGAERDNG